MISWLSIGAAFSRDWNVGLDTCAIHSKMSACCNEGARSLVEVSEHTNLGHRAQSRQPALDTLSKLL